MVWDRPYIFSAKSVKILNSNGINFKKQLLKFLIQKNFGAKNAIQNSRYKILIKF